METMTMKIEFDVMLTITANGCPVGMRLYRGKPMPDYAHTYSNTPEGLKQAQNDMKALEAYVAENSKVTKRKC
jgi:hypothetical protein